jgi:mono/diheme cytochrome c family protein
MLWAAQGRPQQVPILKGVLIAPGVNDPQVLYDTACAACHGASGEGLLGVALFGSGLSANKVRNAVLRGKERSGMPSFEGQFSNSQLEILVEYVAAIGAGQINPPASYSLPQGELRCGDILEPAIACGGN